LNSASQAAIKGLSGLAEYLAESLKRHQQAFSELGVYDAVNDAGTLLANAVAKIEARR
jgi:hypothetical protein